MTLDALKYFIQKKVILLIMFDNDVFWFTMENDPLTDANLEVINGVEFIKRRDFIHSKRGGTNGGISKADIPVWVYKPISDIQSIMVLENIDDLKYIDKGRLYVV